MSSLLMRRDVLNKTVGAFMRRYLHLACVGLLVSVGVLRATVPRVALVVDAPPITAASTSPAMATTDWQTALTAELSRLAPAAELVERADLARLWTERERTALSASPSASAPLGVDRYLHFRRVSDTRWIVEHLDAATGRSLGSFAVDAADLAAAPRLAEAAARLLASPPPADPADAAPRLAVGESTDAVGDAAVFALAARLRTALAANGLTVLDRALTQEIAVEQNDAAKGFRAGPASTARLLGLDYYLELSPADARLVRVQDGVLLGLLPLTPAPPDEKTDAVFRWCLPRLGLTPPAADEPRLPQIETEALAPFYRGISLYDAGRPLEALNEFTRAYLANDRFVQAYEWEARCYEALDMPELAAATRRFLQIGMVENLVAGSARTDSDSAIAFLGVHPATDPALEPLARSCSAWAASALASRPDLALRLPNQLERLRREYDWINGADPLSTALRGQQPPPLFSRATLSARLERHAGRIRLVWQGRDLVSWARLPGESLELDSDSARWPLQVAESARRWHDTPVETPAPRPSPLPAAPDPKRLASAFARASGLEINTARLRLALADPASMLIQGRPFEKGRRNGIENLSDLLEYGLREWRIARLPLDSTTRRWLELERALEHLGPFSVGESRRGAPLDGMAELARLAAPPRRGAPAYLARHLELFSRQDTIPPARLADDCAELLAELAAIDPALIPEQKLLVRHVNALARTARLAAGLVAPDESFIFESNTHEPRPLRLEWQRNGNPLLRAENYRLTMRYLDRQSPAERVATARLALAANPREEAPIDPRWLEEFPDSMELSGPISRMLFELDRAPGLPIAHPLAPDKQRAYLRAVVDHMVILQELWFARARDAAFFRHLDGAVSPNFFHHLQGHTLRELVSNADYDSMHARVTAARDAAAARLGIAGRQDGSDKVVDWRDLTRDLARERRKDFLRETGRWVMNPHTLDQELAETERGFLRDLPEGGRTPDFPAWWKKLREWQFDYAFTAPEMAARYARHAAEAPAYLRSLPKLSLDDAQAFFEQALWLHYGRREADAEPLYRALLELPPRSLAASPGYVPPLAAEAELKANAAFRLAQIAHFAGRNPEAIELALRARELGKDASPRLIAERFTNKWNDRDLLNASTRLLSNLRFDPARTSLPTRVRAVSVPTPNGDNPRLHVFYRTPPPPGSGPAPARRVLVLSPSNNEDALAYLAPDGEWARFADAHDLVLVAPQFHASDTAMRADHRFTHSRYAQVWSGPALLDALAVIGRETPLVSGSLLFHGSTSGGGFATTFAAWRPDLVTAVSVLNGNWSMPRTALPGLRPRTEWRTVSFHIASGELDNYRGDGGLPRFDAAVDFVTRLMGDGVPVEWCPWPGVYYEPSPEMTSAAQDFLARHLAP